ncbi:HYPOTHETICAL PROTEIN MCJ_002290 [Mesomycoplasma conjunctivae]|uniref:Uncharacterized protein n=1 Tax=Mesomycoplasma conjunctivae (strain ATCC 25834 / NCTC 10147 / HRC/581) TaxID=572263 RepID=C5J628_MESCH|nr:hypothetical protein [Mesomycoplasma conjunctivae]CAT04920.1 HYPOTHETICAL PROTEIN MCJ_002290 [Mesomycoplasma conjunctivae]
MHQYLKRIVIKSKGSIDSANHFSFLENLDPKKYTNYNWFEQKLLADSQGNWQNELPKNEYTEEKYDLKVEKLLKFILNRKIFATFMQSYIELLILSTLKYQNAFVFYYNLTLRIFVFNSKKNLYNWSTK